MTADIGSIAKFISDLTGITTLYFERIPEKFKYPSLYFKKVFNPQNDTLCSYRTENTLRVKVFEPKDSLEIAQNIANAIYLRNRKIPILNRDGSKTNKNLKIKNVEVFEGETEEDSQVEINYDIVVSLYKDPTYFENFEITKGVK
ncbi:hypothetical protein [Clostridium phage A2]|uniref:hypothetical protein n=1 Tax=Enterococcus faecium TaxID=1352 RepID=UPI0009475ECC|nr:hypothetical protein [Enterococcus faecium]APQ41981.1 hypothetical protein CloPEP1_0036 [Clostridium phage Clo-PEP-1]AZF89422.1 XkdI [Clostridium phage CPD4]QGF20111.1 hypothetical protein CPAS15_0060 [Clostridium phage CPAS-15]UYE91040.1 hypothetical protein P21_00063 [Clostridium phage P21]WAB24115.1 hypothetical protein [Clostridium phage A2]WAB24192.1 hypothetical protein [Clostridium phage C2]WAB24269.1 hypothetical protein [Clostridium phage H1]WAB24346.1 hypothetical protein [Clos